MFKMFKILLFIVILGYGFFEESFMRVMEELFDLIVVDVGFFDFGLYYLGLGKLFIDWVGVKWDLCYMIIVGVK